jgi:glucan phosphoethanolaminetransferase (alkaline phosphatase superfamily)
MFHSARIEYCLLCQKKRSKNLFFIFLDQAFVILLNFIGVALLYHIFSFSFNCVLLFNISPLRGSTLFILFLLLLTCRSYGAKKYKPNLRNYLRYSSPFRGRRGRLLIDQYPVLPNPMFPSSLPNLLTCFLLPYDPKQKGLKNPVNGILSCMVSCRLR